MPANAGNKQNVEFLTEEEFNKYLDELKDTDEQLDNVEWTNTDNWVVFNVNGF